MAGIDLSQAESKLTSYLAAETAVLTGQAYEFQGRSLTRANLSEIRKGIQFWDGRVKELAAKHGGSGRRRVISPGW